MIARDHAVNHHHGPTAATRRGKVAVASSLYSFVPEAMLFKYPPFFSNLCTELRV
jgi:hypothetical protein